MNRNEYNSKSIPENVTTEPPLAQCHRAFGFCQNNVHTQHPGDKLALSASSWGKSDHATLKEYSSCGEKRTPQADLPTTNRRVWR